MMSEIQTEGRNLREGANFGVFISPPCRVLLVLTASSPLGVTVREHIWAKAGSTPEWVVSPSQGPTCAFVDLVP